LYVFRFNKDTSIKDDQAEPLGKRVSLNPVS